ncbi:interleukin-15 receptor subunit alpha isoform X1 [Columba livia]|uniref:interleukin-15 receptor subunit alpha isoform X1 n=1 Tax=Columba livia TaxID=8932 RepID=UPI0031BAA452
MARPLLPLLCATVVLLLPWTAADTVPPQCGRPKDVANAHIDVGNNVLLNTRLRYTCNPGYKRKAGTSSLIQCILRDGSSEPDWTHTTLQCIRDPALPLQTPSPELPAAPDTKTTTQKAGTTDASPTSSPRLSPLPPATHGPSPETSTLLEMPPSLETSTPGEGTTPGTSLGTTPLFTAPPDHAAGQAASPGEKTHPRGWFQPAKALLVFQYIFPFSTPFLMRVPPASTPFPGFAAKKSPFLSSFPVSIQTLASSIGKLGKNTPYFGKKWVIFFIIFSLKAFLGAVVKCDASKLGRMQHPNFFPGWGGHLANVHRWCLVLHGAVLFELGRCSSAAVSLPQGSHCWWLSESCLVAAGG